MLCGSVISKIQLNLLHKAELTRIIQLIFINTQYTVTLNRNFTDNYFVNILTGHACDKVILTIPNCHFNKHVVQQVVNINLKICDSHVCTDKGVLKTKCTNLTEKNQYYENVLGCFIHAICRSFTFDLTPSACQV